MGRNAKPNSPQTGKTIFVAVVIFLACAFASMLFAAYHRTTIDTAISLWNSLRPAPAVVPHTPLPEHKAARLDKPLPLERLLENSVKVFGSGDFSLADKFARSDFCQIVQTVFPGHAPMWEPSPFDAGATDCIGQLQAEPAQDGTIDNSLFLQIRRNGYGAATMLRLKLVYRPNRMQKVYKTEFEDCAARILTELFLDDQPDLMSDIRALRPFDILRRGLKIKLFEEQLVPGAFNLMIEARCGKYDCPTVSPFYKLGLVHKAPMPELEVEEPQAEP